MWCLVPGTCLGEDRFAKTGSVYKGFAHLDKEDVTSNRWQRRQ